MKQIEVVLPAACWKDIEIIENNEPLVQLVETEKLKIGWIKKGYHALYWVRKTVAEKLYRAAEALPEGMVLVLIEGYRTTQSQQEEWDRVWGIIKAQYHSYSDEAIEKMVRLLVAKPLPLANHHCGGAVDVTLGYTDGTLVDMGTPYITSIPDQSTREKIVMFSEKISWEQNKHRQLLRKAMESQDFVWYPGEWWHYCYGDRMWAVYTQQKQCFYGSVNEF